MRTKGMRQALKQMRPMDYGVCEYTDAGGTRHYWLLDLRAFVEIEVRTICEMEVVKRHVGVDGGLPMDVVMGLGGWQQC